MDTHFAGWESATTIYQAQNDELALNAVLSLQSPHVFKFPINDNEYFLVENRYAGELRLDSLQLVLTEGRNELASMREVLETYLADQVTFSPRGVLIDAKNPDIALPGGGALIWHIDESVINAQIAQNRINDDPAHRGIDLEEADGSQDIGETFDLQAAFRMHRSVGRLILSTLHRIHHHFLKINFHRATRRTAQLSQQSEQPYHVVKFFRK
ncbi:MAG: hypothetical protein R3C26_08100 [Calditrichia bacterium]